MRRRMLAWRPTWNPEEVWVEQVRWIDQTEPETEPESALGEAADPPAEAYKPVLLERILDLCHLPGDILAVVLTAVTVFVGYGISGIAALVATPFVLAARVVGFAPWCVDVRLDGVLVDKRYAPNGGAVGRLIDTAAQDLQSSRFRTELPRAQLLVDGPDHALEPDDLAG